MFCRSPSGRTRGWRRDIREGLSPARARRRPRKHHAAWIEARGIDPCRMSSARPPRSDSPRGCSETIYRLAGTRPRHRDRRSVWRPRENPRDSPASLARKQELDRGVCRCRSTPRLACFHRGEALCGGKRLTSLLLLLSSRPACPIFPTHQGKTRHDRSGTVGKKARQFQIFPQAPIPKILRLF